MFASPRFTVSPRICARGLLMSLSAGALLATSSGIAMAQTASSDEIAELRRQLDALRTEQQRTSDKIAEVEGRLNQVAGVPVSPPPAATAPGAVRTAVTSESQAAPGTAAPPRLQLSGDVRVRYESNWSDKDARNRDRGVVRARLRANYAISDKIMAGAQLSTGDDDDPNTADVTLSNWDDDLRVSLDQIYLRGTFGNLVLTAGKIPQPFRRTDLVWDGDVSPQGLSAAYKIPLRGGAALKATGLVFQIDEASRGQDSRMVGGQAEFATAPGLLRAELAAGYYDYRLSALVGADAGDFRSNLLTPDGRYLSDFDLFDVVGTITFNGLGERWPVQVVGNYVHNYGAAVDADTAYGVDLFVGRTAKKGDWRFGYGYSRTEADAVLAAFSHDNIDLATNYLLHALSLDYVPRENTLLNLTWYHYRPLDPLYAGTNDPRDWLNRVRLNFSVNF